MINPLLSSKLNRNNGHKPINHIINDLLVKRMHVSNACNTNFRLFTVLGDELLIACIYFTLYLGHA